MGTSLLTDHINSASAIVQRESNEKGKMDRMLFSLFKVCSKKKRGYKRNIGKHTEAACMDLSSALTYLYRSDLIKIN